MAKKTDEAKNMQAAMEAVDAALEQSTEDTPPTEGVAASEGTAPTVSETNESGFYIYIGPNMKGLIQTGTIYRGDRANALEKAKAAIEKQPLVKSLIVSGDALPVARLRVKTPGNALYASYKKLAGK